jgi:hypothetical protein
LQARGRHILDRLFRDGIEIMAVCGRTCGANAKREGEPGELCPRGEEKRFGQGKEMQVVRADAQAITDKYQAKVVETSVVTKLGIKEVFVEVARLWNERPKEAEKMQKKQK